MKHRISFYLTYACIVLFGSIGLLLLALGEKSPRESASENRMLAGFPALSAEAVRDGSFMDGLESYLSDGMPARERIVTDTAVLLNAIALSKEDGAEENVFDEIGAPAQMPEETGLPQADTILLEPDAPQTPEPTDCPPADAVPSPSGSPENTEPMQTAIPVAACSLRRIRPDGTSRMTETYSETSIQNAIDVLNAYRSVLPEDGRLFFTQSPYASVALTMQHGEFTGWESDVEAMLQSNTLSGVEIVSTIDVLEEPLLAGEDLFFRTDHHWTPRGACYLAQAMLKRMGIDAPDYDAYSYKTYRSFYGSTVTAHPERKSTTTPDTIDVLIPNLPVKGCTIAWDGSEKPCPFILENNNTYRAYLGGTYGPWRRFETGVDTGRRCLVIGDSFTTCFIPYLAPYYEEIHSTNYRPDNYNVGRVAWGAADYIKEHGISDIFIVVCTEDDINSPFMLEWMRKYL